MAFSKTLEDRMFSKDASGKRLTGIRVGIPKQYRVEGLSAEILKVWGKGIQSLIEEGAESEFIIFSLLPFFLASPSSLSSFSFFSLILLLLLAFFSVQEVDLPTTEYALPAYYIIACAEASSNLARYDGIKYGLRNSSASNLEELYFKTRSSGFGKEVQRRMLMGAFCLSRK
jgi:aspartyl-tRNA(Asn)/glutamyl-tRNA(Gln) amidotransferase subunit A